MLPLNPSIAYQSTQPFNLLVEVMEAYYDTYRTFSRLALSESFQFCFKLCPGDLYMIDNHRILHGRLGFSMNGQRHLQACYVGRDGLLSQLAMLNRQGN